MEVLAEATVSMYISILLLSTVRRQIEEAFTKRLEGVTSKVSLESVSVGF